MQPTAATLASLTAAASAGVRASRTPTVAQLASAGGSDLILASSATRTVASLRGAHAALGADRLEVALGTLTKASLAAALSRLDPHRPNLRHESKASLVFILSEIAAGGALFPAEDDVRPIGVWKGFDLNAGAFA